MSVNSGKGEVSDLAQTLVWALRDLHHRAGRPSARAIAKAVGTVSHTTVAEALSGKRMPSWQILAGIVRHLGGDEATFRLMWAATAMPGIAPTLALGARRPQELPRPVSNFVGRSQELQILAELVGGRHGPAGAGVVAISGMGGVGKTTLAVHAAHQIVQEFPDGCLFVNLDGFAPRAPIEPADALASFLRALGVDGPHIPPSLEDRAAWYRSLTAGRQLLILLDNASSTEQILPLLPGATSSTVLITSRNRLSGLVARYGAHQLSLDVLSPEEASQLLRSLMGDRVDADPLATARLADFCGRLPLALRIAAEWLAMRPQSQISDLVAALADEHRRLERLSAGDEPGTAIATVFSWSYGHLPDDTGRVFRLFGLNPGPQADARAVAALVNESFEETQRHIDVLLRAHLVEETAAGRVRIHDLLRSYAADRATMEDDEPTRRAALTRLFDYYLSSAVRAVDLLFSTDRHGRPRIQGGVTIAPPFSDVGKARSWLDTELSNLIAVANYAAKHEWGAHATQLSVTLWRYLDTGGHYAAAQELHGQALAAARDQNDLASEGAALHYLGLAHLRCGQVEDALECLEQALQIRRTIGDRVSEARTLNNLGLVYQEWGRYQEARNGHQLAIQIFRDSGDRVLEAAALNNLGTVYRREKRYQEALNGFEQALRIFREAGDLVNESAALDSLGVLHGLTGRPDEAFDYLQRAFVIHREVGNRTDLAETVNNLGMLCQRFEQFNRAVDYFQEALVLARGIGNRRFEVAALNGLAETYRAMRSSEKARIVYEEALAIAGELGFHDEQARSLSGLGAMYSIEGKFNRAHRYWRHALAIYTDLEMPEADSARARLVELGGVAETDATRNVVLLTTLQMEYQAIRAHLTNMQRHRDSAGSLFEAGHFPEGKGRVVIAVSPEGNRGMTVLAEKAIRIFQPHALLLVGVAGGLKSGLNLGDVVVATKVYGYQGGKEDDDFLTRPCVWEAPNELVQLARYIARMESWTRLLTSEAGRQRPRAHFKPIAVRETIFNLCSTPITNKLRRIYDDAAAIEMEGPDIFQAGLFSHPLPVLTVRGISDRLDEPKRTTDEKTWLPVAAARAAAFALALAAEILRRGSDDGPSLALRRRVDRTEQ